MRLPASRLAVIGLILPASLLIAAIVTNVVFAIGMHEEIGSPLAAAGVLLCLGAGGALWARTLARVAGLYEWQSTRVALAGALGHAVPMLAAVVALGALERALVEEGGTTLPLHVLYTLLFVPVAFITSGLGALAVAFAAGLAERAPRVALVPAIGSALAYLALNVLQDVLGRRVGGPFAGETATMITVTFVCCIGSAVALTVLLGRALLQAHLTTLPEPAATPSAATQLHRAAAANSEAEAARSLL